MLVQKIAPLIEDLIQGFGLVLIELNIHALGGKTGIELFIDKPKGGITIDDCAQINRKLGDLIDQQNLIENSYVLEVSSPGLDRPLKTVKDFFRMMGRNVRFFLAQSVENKMEHVGLIKSVNDDRVLIETKSAQEVIIPMAFINKARLEINF